MEISDSFSNAPGSMYEAGPALIVGVQRAEGTKCERCWNYSTRVGESERYPTVCERCLAALEEIEQGVAAS